MTIRTRRRLWTVALLSQPLLAVATFLLIVWPHPDAPPYPTPKGLSGSVSVQQAPGGPR